MISSFGPAMCPIQGAVVVSIVGSFMVAGPGGGLIILLLWAQPAIVVALFSPCTSPRCSLFPPHKQLLTVGVGGAAWVVVAIRVVGWGCFHGV
jgi:hypothetical protein